MKEEEVRSATNGPKVVGHSIGKRLKSAHHFNVREIRIPTKIMGKLPHRNQNKMQRESERKDIRKGL